MTSAQTNFCRSDRLEVEELRLAIEEKDASLIVFDDELSP
jgi:50S ribosomal subunit-associated GTPase HflX